MIEKIMQEMGLPLLFTVLLLYYAIKLLVFQDRGVPLFRIRRGMEEKPEFWFSFLLRLP